MATIRTVITECDMPHATNKTPAESFTLFSLAVGEYTVDLCEKCAAKVLAPVMANGRQTAKPGYRSSATGTKRLHKKRQKKTSE